MPRGRLSPFLAVARSGVLLRIEGGYLLSSIAEWAVWVAIVVYAYGRGGATEAGVVGFALGMPSIVVIPVASALGDRWPRARVLLGAYVVQAVSLVGGALLLGGDAALGAYGIAIVATTVVGVERSFLAALLPNVAERPEELTAANVVLGVIEGLGALVGPLVAGVILALGGPPLVLGVCGVAVAVSAAALLPVARGARRAGDEHTDDASPSLGSVLGELTGGLAAVRADPRLIAVIATIAAAIGLLGALEVFIVVIAIDVLGLDDAAVGYLTAVNGFGALLGSAAGVVLVGRERLGLPLLAATILFGLAVASLGAAQDLVLIAIALVAGGIGWSFAYVAATTLTQRLAGDDVMARVFGVSEAVQMTAESVGILLVPLLIVALGPVNAVVAAGVGLAVVALVVAGPFLRAERADPAFLRDVALLRAVPMFNPLSGPVVERLAAGTVHVTAEAGEWIVREGDRGDRFYVLETGVAEVTVRGRVAGTLGPGDGFGEIALLHDVPRTASVRATGPGTMVALERGPFLEALTGQPRSRTLAVEVAARRLAADAPSGPGDTGN